MNLLIKPKEVRRIIIYASIFFALLKPDSLEYIGLGWLDTLLIGCDGFVLAYLGIKMLERKFHVSSMTTCVCFLYFSMAFSTLLKSHEYYTLLKVAGPAIATCLFTDLCMQRRPVQYLKAVVYLLTILYTLNFITIVMYYPDGMYTTDWVVGDTYLMGFDNGMIYNFLPLCCFACLYSYVMYSKVFTGISIYAMALSLVSEIYVQSGTGMIQMALLLSLFLLIDKNIIKKLIRPLPLFAVFYLGTIAITKFRIQNYMAGFIVGVLGKDVPLTGRTYLWDYAMSVIKENPIFGIGATGRSVQGLNGHVYPHPHCLLLDFMYKGGIFMLTSFVLLTVLFERKYKRCLSPIIRNIILATIFVFLVGEIVNSTQYKIFFWAIFVMIEYGNTLEDLRKFRLENA